MSISKSRINNTKITEKDAIIDKEDIDREGINVVYGMDVIDSDLISDKDEAEYEGEIKFDDAEWSDSGQEVRQDLDDEE